MEDAIAVLLRHLGVDVVAAVAELGDGLRQELHALGGVAEDDGLVDLQLKLQIYNYCKFVYNPILQ